MSKEFQLERYKRDRLTKEETLVPFFFHREDITCLYRDRNGTFIVTKQGFVNKVPYKFSDLKEHLDL
tara:strand:- start:12411 stop:12611 length:201 start_codon:yes stop_codon:yes gene_type:complete